MNLPIVIVSGVVIALGGFFAWRRFESMRGKSSEELRAILRSSEWLFYRNALVELRRRGEDIENEVTPVLNLVISDAKRQRIAGWIILRELYPDLAARVPDYKPHEAADACKEKMRKIFLREGSPNPNSQPTSSVMPYMLRR